MNPWNFVYFWLKVLSLLFLQSCRRSNHKVVWLYSLSASGGFFLWFIDILAGKILWLVFTASSFSGLNLKFLSLSFLSIQNKMIYIHTQNIYQAKYYTMSLFLQPDKLQWKIKPILCLKNKTLQGMQNFKTWQYKVVSKLDRKSVTSYL